MSTWGLIAESFHSLQSLSVSCFHVILGLPRLCFPSTCMWKAVLTAPLEHSTCPYQWSLLSFRMRSKSSMPSRTSSSLDLVVTMYCSLILQICLITALSTVDAGDLALSMAKFYWHGALRSAHKSCTHGHMSWKRGGVKRELVAAPWTSSRRFSHMLWLKVHSHLLLRVCLLGSKKKLPPPACQVQPGLPSVVCHPKSMQFPGTVYICSQGPLSSAWALCISCAPSACSHCRCCCCPLQCDRRCMETRLNSAGGPGPYCRSWSSSILHLLSVLSFPLLLSKSRASCDTFLERFSDDNMVISIEVFPGDPRAELLWCVSQYLGSR